VKIAAGLALTISVLVVAFAAYRAAAHLLFGADLTRPPQIGELCISGIVTLASIYLVKRVSRSIAAEAGVRAAAIYAIFATLACVWFYQGGGLLPPVKFHLVDFAAYENHGHRFHSRIHRRGLRSGAFLADCGTWPTGGCGDLSITGVGYAY
jgi:hypothetical protein